MPTGSSRAIMVVYFHCLTQRRQVRSKKCFCIVLNSLHCRSDFSYFGAIYRSHSPPWSYWYDRSIAGCWNHSTRSSCWQDQWPWPDPFAPHAGTLRRRWCLVWAIPEVLVANGASNSIWPLEGTSQVHRHSLDRPACGRKRDCAVGREDRNTVVFRGWCCAGLWSRCNLACSRCESISSIPC